MYKHTSNGAVGPCPCRVDLARPTSSDGEATRPLIGWPALHNRRYCAPSVLLPRNADMMSPTPARRGWQADAKGWCMASSVALRQFQHSCHPNQKHSSSYPLTDATRTLSRFTAKSCFILVKQQAISLRAGTTHPELRQKGTQMNPILFVSTTEQPHTRLFSL